MSINIENVFMKNRKTRKPKLDKFSHLYYIPRAVLSTVSAHKKSRAGFKIYKDLSCSACCLSFHKRAGLESHKIEVHDGVNIPTKKKSTSTKYKKKTNLNESINEYSDSDDDISIIEDISVLEDDDDEISVVEQFSPSSSRCPKTSSPMKNKDKITSFVDEKVVDKAGPSKMNKKKKTGLGETEDLIISFPAGEWEWMVNYPVFTPEIWLGGHVNKALRASKNEDDSDIEMVEDKKLSRKRQSLTNIHGGNKRPKNTKESPNLNSSMNNNDEGSLDLSEFTKAVNALIDDDVTIVDLSDDDKLKNPETMQLNISDLLYSEGSDDEVECINLE